MVLLTQPEIWVLGGQDGQGEQTTDHIYHRSIGFLKVQYNALWIDQHPCDLLETCLGDLNLI